MAICTIQMTFSDIRVRVTKRVGLLVYTMNVGGKVNRTDVIRKIARRKLKRKG